MFNFQNKKNEHEVTFKVLKLEDWTRNSNYSIYYG